MSLTIYRCYKVHLSVSIFINPGYLRTSYINFFYIFIICTSAEIKRDLLFGGVNTLYALASKFWNTNEIYIIRFTFKFEVFRAKTMTSFY
jgi:hypothetical protein